LVLIVAAVAMPWVTYENRATHVTTQFKGGRLGIILVVLGLASITLAVMLYNRASTLLMRIHFGIGCAAWILSVVVALAKIKSANNVNKQAPSSTSFAAATVVAVVASAAIALTSAAELNAAKRNKTRQGPGALNR
jgi:cytochrome b561